MASTFFREATEAARNRTEGFENRALTSIRSKQGTVPSLGEAAGSGGLTGLTAPNRAGNINREAYNQFKNWVYACVNIIARRISGQPIMAGAVLDAPPNPDRRGPLTAKSILAKSLTPDFVKDHTHMTENLEVINTHPVLDLLCRPNPVQGKAEFIYFWVSNLLLTGEAYWFGGVVEDEGEKRIEAWAIPSSWIVPNHQDGLFSSYTIRVSPTVKFENVPPENVARTFLPDPTDPKLAYSPLRAILSPVRVDSHIVNSQEDAFARGIHPNLLVTVGKVRGADGKLTDRRPVLSGSQRNQIVRAIRQIWNQTINEGYPGIIDGMIESVSKLDANPREMDWMTSGESVKRRILQVFGMNEIILGSTLSGNRAQAVEAEKHFCSNVNPYISAFSETATRFFGPMFDTPERLLVWLEKCEALDADLQFRKMSDALKSGAIDTNEYRAFLGMPPSETETKATLATTVGGINGAVNILRGVGEGVVTRSAAVAMLQFFFEIDQSRAAAIVGDVEPVELLPEPTPTAPSEEEPEIAEEVEELTAIGDLDIKAIMQLDDDESIALVAPELIGKEVILTKSGIESMHLKQVGVAERRLSRNLQDHFKRSVRDTADAIGKLEIEIDPQNAEEQAAAMMNMVFDLKRWQRDVKQVSVAPLVRTFVEGAQNEVVLNTIAMKTKEKRTTAEEIAERLDIEVPEEISIGELPEWMQEAARDKLVETFEQDYWLDVPLTTRNDIQATLQESMERGFSTRRIATEIMRSHGGLYDRIRATRVARTEIPDMLNAGHAAGISQLEEESGLAIGKEWLSVLSNTTRPSHAALDGVQTTSADGTFSLGGVDVPHPAHSSLPPGERISCFCTVISAFVMDEIRDESELGKELEEEANEQRPEDQPLIPEDPQEPVPAPDTTPKPKPTPRPAGPDTGELDRESIDEQLIRKATEIQDRETEQLIIVNRNGTVHRTIDGNENSVSLSNDDLKSMEGRITLHNHPAPSGVDATFSTADIAGAIQRGEFETHVIGQRGSKFAMSYGDNLSDLSKRDRFALAKRVQRDYDTTLRRQAKAIVQRIKDGELTDTTAVLQLSNGAWEEVAARHGFTYTGL